ncbi:MAG: hypothetical protein LBK06_07025 [Planctomycetaceae bacterium]|nr:hypothetical protein [Planctomycetaceae bacterium]
MTPHRDAMYCVSIEVVTRESLNEFLSCIYAEAVLKFTKLNTAAQQREAVTRGRSLLPYRLRYIIPERLFLSKGRNRKHSFFLFQP